MQIDGVNATDAAGESQVTFAANGKSLDKLEDSKAAAVLVAEKIEKLSKTQLVVEDVNVALIKALEVFAPELQKSVSGVHSSAVVAASAKVAASASSPASSRIPSRTSDATCSRPAWVWWTYAARKAGLAWWGGSPTRRLHRRSPARLRQVPASSR